VPYVNIVRDVVRYERKYLNLNETVPNYKFSFNYMNYYNHLIEKTYVILKRIDALYVCIRYGI
jgi:hypothetical protein